MRSAPELVARRDGLVGVFTMAGHTLPKAEAYAEVCVMFEEIAGVTLNQGQQGLIRGAVDKLLAAAVPTNVTVTGVATPVIPPKA